MRGQRQDNLLDRRADGGLGRRACLREQQRRDLLRPQALQLTFRHDVQLECAIFPLRHGDFGGTHVLRELPVAPFAPEQYEHAFDGVFLVALVLRRVAKQMLHLGEGDDRRS